MSGTKRRTLSPRAWFNRQAALMCEIPEKDLDLFYCDSDKELLKLLAEKAEAFDAFIGSDKPPMMDPVEIRKLRTFYGSLKKYRDPVDGVDSADFESAALQRYKTNNLAARANSIPARFLSGMVEFLSEELASFDCECDLPVPRFGNGGVEEKASVIKRWISLPNQPWLNWRDPLDYKHRDSEAMRSPMATRCRLHAVPKDWNKKRLITIEPYLKSYLQQTVRQYILAALLNSRCGDLRSMARCEYLEGKDPQERHRRMALAGSVDGSLATLDLRDASDLVSWNQVCSVFPLPVQAQLERARSEQWVDPHDHTDGDVYMFGGMGNACTFIVETLMFHAACHAIARYHGIKHPRISVYGDDIICSGELAEVIMRNRIFEEFGWHINPSKSYWSRSSRFRESCGVQAFNGEDVTLLRYMGGYDGPGGLFALRDLIDHAGASHAWLVPSPWPEAEEIPNIWSSTDGGLTTHIPWWPETVSDREMRVRWNPTLQRSEMQLLHLQTRREVIPIRGASNQLGVVYGALSGQLKGKTLIRRSKGAKFSKALEVVVDYPKVQKLVCGWTPFYS